MCNLCHLPIPSHYVKENDGIMTSFKVGPVAPGSVNINHVLTYHCHHGMGGS